MNHQSAIVDLTELLAKFMYQIKVARELNLTDINKISEDVLVPIFRIAFECPHLKNLNTKDEENFPSVDLGDEKARVCFQITSTSDSDKVRSTLEKFIRHNLDVKFDWVRVYILTEKNKLYRGQDWDKIVDNRFRFDKDRDILDWSDLVEALKGRDLSVIQDVVSLLEEAIGDGRPPLIKQSFTEKLEPIFLNLLSVKFSEQLYIAQLDDEKIKPKTPFQKRPKQWKSSYSDNDRVRLYFQERDIEVDQDWVCHGGNLITFRNLFDVDENLREVVHPETIEEIGAREFYNADDDQERVFKFLLDRCLSVRLKPKKITWQHKEKLFIFLPLADEEIRREGWGKTIKGRIVYEKRKKTKGEHIGELLNHKHLGFSTQYFRFNEDWFVCVKPEWFISWDGYNKSNFGASDVDYLKKNEGNQNVANQVQFITYVLQHDIESNLFEEATPYPYIQFGELIGFRNGPKLYDEDWRKGEDDSKGKPTEDLEVLWTSDINFQEESGL